MAAPIKVNPVTSLKKDSIWLHPTCADVTAPKDTEINDAAGIYATCFLLDDQAGIEETINKVRLQALLCQDKTYEALAPSDFSHGDIVGVVNPQAASADDAKKLFEFLRDGYSGFLTSRQGVLNDVDDQVVAGEFVNTVPCDISAASLPFKTANGAEGFYVFRAGVAVKGAVGNNVAVAVGP